MDWWDIATKIGGGAAGGAGWALFMYEKWQHAKTQERCREREDAQQANYVALLERTLKALSEFNATLSGVLAIGSLRAPRSR